MGFLDFGELLYHLSFEKCKKKNLRHKSVRLNLKVSDFSDSISINFVFGWLKCWFTLLVNVRPTPTMCNHQSLSSYSSKWSDE